MTEINAELTSHFERLLAAHDLQPTRYKDWVTLSGSFPAFRASYEGASDQNLPGRLSVQIMLDEGILLNECFAAIGPNDVEAVKGALLAFNVSMFHPILAAYGVRVSEDQIKNEIWNTADEPQNAWAGDIFIRASDGVSISPPIDWIANLRSAAKNSKLRNSFNWITAYFFRMNNDAPLASATLNNEDWQAGLAAMLELEWPIADGFYGCRLFVILRAGTS